MNREETLAQQVKEAGPEAWKLYRQILANGETAEWAAMCAHRQPPGSRYTARAYEYNLWNKMGKMSKLTRDKLLDTAHRAGVSTQGKFYTGAGPATDAASWVSSAEDFLTLPKKRNLTLSGALKYEGAPKDVAPKRIALAPDLVKRYMAQECQRDPALAEKVQKSRKARGELREKVIAKYGRKPK